GNDIVVGEEDRRATFYQGNQDLLTFGLLALGADRLAGRQREADADVQILAVLEPALREDRLLRQWLQLPEEALQLLARHAGELRATGVGIDQYHATALHELLE